MQNAYLNLLATSWKHSEGQRLKYVLVYSSYTLVALIDASKPLMYGWFISHLEKDVAETLRYTMWYVLLYILADLIEWGIKSTARINECDLAHRISKNFSMETMSRVLQRSLQWHGENQSGLLLNKIRKSGFSLHEFFKNGFNYYLSFMRLVISLFYIIWYSPLFGGLSVLIGVLIIWFILKIDKNLVSYLSKQNRLDDKVSGVTSESLTNIKTISILRIGRQILDAISEKIDATFDPFIRYIKLNELKWFVADMLIAVIYGVSIIGYVVQNSQAGMAIAIAPLVTLLLYVNQFTGGFNSVAWLYNQIVQLNTNVNAVADIYADTVQFNNVHNPSAMATLPVGWSHLKIANLSFSYQPGIKGNVLDNFSIKLEPGKKIALIGRTGGGKSTLLSVLRGLYVPNQGLQIYVDDALSYDNLDLISNNCTLIPQEPEIFENTLWYNLTFGLPYSCEEVAAACSTSRFTEVVELLTSGLDTVISENGANFSGGQRQRLALARGILAARDSAIVLIDEPTSSIDHVLTRQIYDQLFKHFTKKSLVVALHNLELLPLFDYIYIIDEGKIKEEGTFDQLIGMADSRLNLMIV